MTIAIIIITIILLFFGVKYTRHTTCSGNESVRNVTFSVRGHVKAAI